MTTTFIELPLYAERKYSYGISLEGVSYTLTFYWNRKAKSWHMDIHLEDRTQVVLGVALVPQYPMLVDYNLEEIGMNGHFELMPVNADLSSKAGEEFSIIPEFFRLYYVYTDTSNI